MLDVLLVATTIAQGFCTPITLQEAKELVLMVPDARDAVRLNGAILDVDLEVETQSIWMLRVFATNATSVSNLIGHYSVDKRSFAVADFVLGRPIINSELERMEADLRRRHCSK